MCFQVQLFSILIVNFNPWVLSLTIYISLNVITESFFPKLHFLKASNLFYFLTSYIPSIVLILII